MGKCIQETSYDFSIDGEIELYDYYNRYIDETMDRYNESCNGYLEHYNQKEKPVFTMWLRGYENAPDLVKACLSSMKRLDKEIIFVSEANLDEYVDIPFCIKHKWNSHIISNAHFSDYVRVCLLERYGGAWIDSTVYVAREVPDYMFDGLWFHKRITNENQKRVIGNWWLSADKEDKMMRLMKIALEVYWEKEEYARHYYFFHVMFKRILDEYPDLMKAYDSMIEQYTNNTHLLRERYDKQYDSNEWERMKYLSPVFKCTYKNITDVRASTYLDYLLLGKLP